MTVKNYIEEIREIVGEMDAVMEYVEGIEEFKPSVDFKNTISKLLHAVDETKDLLIAASLQDIRIGDLLIEEDLSHVSVIYALEFSDGWDYSDGYFWYGMEDGQKATAELIQEALSESEKRFLKPCSDKGCEHDKWCSPTKADMEQVKAYETDDISSAAGWNGDEVWRLRSFARAAEDIKKPLEERSYYEKLIKFSPEKHRSMGDTIWFGNEPKKI